MSGRQLNIRQTFQYENVRQVIKMSGKGLLVHLSGEGQKKKKKEREREKITWSLNI